MPPGSRPPVLRVAQLNRLVGRKLEGWKLVWVEGEISDLSRPPSGHLYFSLNDSTEPAQIRVMMYRTDLHAATANMRNGERIRICGRFTIYEPRGALQIQAHLTEPAGEGDRRQQLERLKKKLAAEGLFAVERKRPLPRMPTVVGLVTSQAGAALHDVVRVAAGRAPVRLVVAHCRVQGPDAPASIVRALRRMYRLPGLDVVILTRGGGAAEDLSAFNDEAVARAVSECPVPLVSGVGHEVDETIVDLVADVRAATPSNAAELVVPDAEALRRELVDQTRRLQQVLEHQVGRARLRLERLERRLSDPRRALGGVRHRFASSSSGLERAVARALLERRTRLSRLTQRLARADPRATVARDRARFEACVHRLERAGRQLVVAPRRELLRHERALSASLPPALLGRRAQLARHAAQLDALSPLRVLARGYAIAIHQPSGRALLGAHEASVGDLLSVRLARGSLTAEVQATFPEEDER